ncbi:HAD-IA family hydrolase [Planctomycetota bacterium]
MDLQNTACITLDGYNTLLALDSPFEHLQEALAENGMDVPMETAEKALTNEMVYYREHHLEGRDMHSLHDLHIRCADVLFSGLEEQGFPSDFSVETQVDILLCPISFSLFPDTVPFLELCRENSIMLAVISNWDCTLPDILDQYGIKEYFKKITVSALENEAKPNPGLFTRTVRLLGVSPETVTHIGDDIDNDIIPAQKAGMEALLIDRNQKYPEFKGEKISSLEGIFKL